MRWLRREAVKKSRVARIASATASDASRADESMQGHRRGGATKQMASARRDPGRPDFFTASERGIDAFCEAGEIAAPVLTRTSRRGAAAGS